MGMSDAQHATENKECGHVYKTTQKAADYQHSGYFAQVLGRSMIVSTMLLKKTPRT